MIVAVNVIEVGLLVLAMLAVGGLATWALNRRRRDVWHELAVARGLTFSDRSDGPRVSGHLDGRLVEVSLDDFSSDRDLGGVEVVRIAVALYGVSPAITAEGIPGLIGDLAALGEERVHFSSEAFQHNVLVSGDDAQARAYWSPPRQEAFLELVQKLPCDQVELRGGRVIAELREVVSDRGRLERILDGLLHAAASLDNSSGGGGR
jgi:hypothetical protein